MIIDSRRLQLPIVTEEFLYEALGCNVAKLKPKSMPAKIKTNSEELLVVKIDKRSENVKLRVSERNVPIMSPVLETQVESTIAMYKDGKKWKEWGLSGLREGGAVVLFEGPPGTGKTMIAEYLSKKVGKGLVRLNMKDIGGKAPGDTERRCAETFTTAKLKGMATIFMDECDTLLVSRDRISSDGQYMIGVINELLTQISAYRGLICLATNRAQYLDPALQRRLLARIHVGKPEIPERLRLWLQKIPAQYPLRLTTVQYDALASLMLTGAEIETAIILESSNAIYSNRQPTFATLQNVAASLVQP